MNRSRSTQSQNARHRVNIQSRDVAHLFAPVLKTLGDEVLTPAEIVHRLPGFPPRDIRRALLVMRDDGVLTRATDSTAALYSRADENPETSA